MRIDAHQHFWRFDSVRDTWMTNEMDVLKRDYLPEDIYPLLYENNFDGCVTVQADQSPAETQFLQDFATLFNQKQMKIFFYRMIFVMEYRCFKNMVIRMTSSYILTSWKR